MTDEAYDVITSNYFLEPGYIYVATKPTIISTVTGSSVVVCIYDRKLKIGGVNHFLYPKAEKREEATAMFGNAATLNLIRMMIDNGSKTKHLEAQIVGGAHNPELSPINIGRRNVLAVRRVLLKKGIRIVSEDVEGVKGRKIVFHTNINEIAILKVDRLRKSDWYPYEGHR